MRELNRKKIEAKLKNYSGKRVSSFMPKLDIEGIREQAGGDSELVADFFMESLFANYTIKKVKLTGVKNVLGFMPIQVSNSEGVFTKKAHYIVDFGDFVIDLLNSDNLIKSVDYYKEIKKLNPSGYNKEMTDWDYSYLVEGISEE